MKKLFFLSIMLIGLTYTMEAQDVKFGVKAGVNFAKITVPDDVESVKGRTGFNIGAVAQFSLADTFALQPEIMYSAQGSDAIDIDYINVPILLKLKLAKVLSIEAGPQFGFVVKDGYEDIENNIASESFDLGVAMGAGVEFGKFFGQARYNIGITEVTEDSDFKNSAFQISIGYYLF